MTSLLLHRRLNFTTISSVRGFHVYRSFWKPDLKKTYHCARERDNEHDEYAVAIYHEGTVVGYVPREFSRSVSNFLGTDGSQLECRIIGSPYEGKGIELPCRYMFEGLKDNIHDIKKTFEAQTMPLKEKELAMIEGQIRVKGRMQVQRIFLHGPPGAGKSSVLRVILGQSPLEENDQNSTGIIEPPERLVTANKLIKTTSHRDWKKVNEHLIFFMIAEQLKLLCDNDDKENTNRSLQDNDDKENESNAGPSKQNQLLPSQSGCEPQTSQLSSQETTQLINQIGEKLKQLQKTKKKLVVPSPFSVLWVHLIDSGGQPQFTELLPLVYPSDKNFYFFVIRLTDRLDQKQYSKIIQNGKEFKSEVLSHTLFEMIENFCKTAKLSHSHVKIIGTHLDCIQECDETLEDKETQLQNLKEKYEDVLICNEDGSVIYALNAMEENDETRTQYKTEFNNIILDKEVLCVDEEVPLSWLVLQLVIDRESRDGVISYSDVQRFANDLSISDPSKALQFFSKLALTFFFPDVLPNIIIDELGVLTCNISQIIFSTISPSATRPPTKDLIKFRKTGICHKSLFSRLCGSSMFPINDIFTLDHLLSILQHLKILHALPDRAERFFFPGILPLASSASNEQLKPDSSALWFFLLEDAPLPHAFFCGTIVSLLCNKSISLCTGRKVQQYRNDISLEYHDTLEAKRPVGVIRLIDCIYWMEIYWQPISSRNETMFHFIRSIVEAQAKIVFKHLKLESLCSAYELGLSCPKERCGIDEEHPCRFLQDISGKISFQCTLDGRQMWSEDKIERTVWFQSDNSDNINDVTMTQSDDEGSIAHDTTENVRSLRKRSSPSQDDKNDGTRKKPTSTSAEIKISLENFITSRSSLIMLTNSLWNENLIPESVHQNIMHSQVLFTELVFLLQSEVNSTITPHHKDSFVRILRDQNDPTLKLLADKLDNS